MQGPHFQFVVVLKKQSSSSKYLFVKKISYLYKKRKITKEREILYEMECWLRQFHMSTTTTIGFSIIRSNNMMSGGFATNQPTGS